VGQGPAIFCGGICCSFAVGVLAAADAWDLLHRRTPLHIGGKGVTAVLQELPPAKDGSLGVYVHIRVDAHTSVFVYAMCEVFLILF